jgi:ribosomal protein S18 acetylase RimI-like enzyme
MTAITVEPLSDADQDWLRSFWTRRWGAPVMVSRGRVHHVEALPGFCAEVGGKRVGLVTYHIEGDACEITSLDSLQEGIGVGSALLKAVRTAAKHAGCSRLWLITTNDNLSALGFYQKRGFTLAALHCNALERSRQLKPEIPLIGLDGIPLRDEIELVMPL